MKMQRQALLTTAIAGVLSLGYGGRGAYGGSCAPTGGGTYECTGGADDTTDTTQTISAGGVTVTTTSGFGIDTSTSGGNGITINNQAGGAGLTFTDSFASSITGGDTGLNVINNGLGETVIDVNGTIEGLGLNGNGILARGGVTSGDLTITAGGDVMGDHNGIQALAGGAGSNLSVTTTGSVTGDTNNGIYAIATPSVADVSVSANNATGQVHGIIAVHTGTGELEVTASGNVVGTDSNGVYAAMITAGTDVTVSVADATGGNDGINTINTGTGMTEVTASGMVSGLGRNGIYARNYSATTTDLSITANDVSGAERGILAENQGTGFTSVTVDGAVSGTSLEGIRVRNTDDATTIPANGLSMEITTGLGSTVSGGRRGMEVANRGAGGLSVTVNGDVTGGDLQGLYASNRNNTVGMTVRQAAGSTISSTGTAGFGLQALAFSGSNTIDVDGNVTSAHQVGIFGVNVQTATDLTITTGDGLVSGSTTSGVGRGIFAFQNGTGAVRVETGNGAVSGRGGGITVRSLAGMAELTVTTGAGDIIGDAGGSTGYSGIDIDGSAGNTYTTVTTGSGAVRGGSNGISVAHRGSGATRVTTGDGNVRGVTADGIFAINSAAATIPTDGLTMEITTGSGEVRGQRYGILAVNLGAGGLGVTATGSVVGTDSDGVFAYQSTDGTDLTVSVASVTGGQDGVQAESRGSGELTVIATGLIQTTYENGVEARQEYGTNVTVSVADVTAGDDGVEIDNFGTGVTEVTATGTVSGSGGANGIDVYNGGTTTGLSITARNVSADDHAVYARHYGSGALSVSVSGAVDSATGDGIATLTGAGGTTTIMLNSGADVGGGSGIGIYNDAGDSGTTVMAGAMLRGEARLGDGTDTMTFTGGDLSAITILDGGDDLSDADGFVDRLTFAGVSGTLDGAGLLNWEEIAVTAGTMDFGSSLTTSDADGRGLMISGSGTVDGGTAFSLTGNLDIGAGGTFDATGGGAGVFSFANNVTNLGRITTQDGAVGDVISIAGEFTGGGTLAFDADGATNTADTLLVAGDVTGAPTTVEVSDASSGAATGEDILLIDVSGNVAAGDFVLSGGAVTFGIFDYELEAQGSQFVLVGGLNSSSAVYRAVPHVLLDVFGDLPTLQERRSQQQRSAGQQQATRLAFDPALRARVVDRSAITPWVRLTGERSEADLSGAVSYDATFSGVQAGADFALESGAAGQWVLGAWAHVQDGSADVTMAGGTGSVETDGIGIGASATWYGHGGTYVDLQGQVTWAESDFTSSAGGTLATGVDVTVYALSAEVGHRIALDANRTLIPQGQLIWSRVEGDRFIDSGGTLVDLGDNDRLIGRLGLAYEQVWAGQNGPSSLNIVGNILHDFDSDSTVSAAGNTLIADREETWAEIGVGTSVDLGRNGTIFGNVAYRQALDGDGMGVSASAGWRLRW